MTKKPSFFHTAQFNSWLIVSFFTVTVAVFVFLPVMGAYRVGTAIGAEMSRHGPVAGRTLGAPESEPARRPPAGVPVAFRSARIGP